MMIEQGAADAVLSVSYHPKREQNLHFTAEQRAFARGGPCPPDYLWMSEYVLFVKNKDRERIAFESYQQLAANGVRIGINKGYTYSADFPALELKTTVYNSTREGFQALVNGDIDLYPMDRTVGLEELDAMGLLASIGYFPTRLFAKPYLAPFSKHSDYPDIELVMEQFNRELRYMRASGEYQTIYHRHCRNFPLPTGATKE